MSATQTARSTDVLYEMGYSDGFVAARKSSRSSQAFQDGYNKGREDINAVWAVANTWKARYESCHRTLAGVSAVTCVAILAALFGWLR